MSMRRRSSNRGPFNDPFFKGSFDDEFEHTKNRIRMGHTAILFLWVIMSVAFMAVAYTFCTGNVWWNDSRALAKIQIDHPDVSKVVTTERHVYAPSKITVDQDDGVLVTYCIDTDAMWNIAVVSCPTTTTVSTP